MDQPTRDAIKRVMHDYTSLATVSARLASAANPKHKSPLQPYEATMILDILNRLLATSDDLDLLQRMVDGA